MLKEILSPATCARCRYCCEFDAGDMWDMPLLDADCRRAVEKILPAAALRETDGETRFDLTFPPGEVRVCPALTAQGCALGAEKPFECRMWPLRVMKINGQLALTLSSQCRGVLTVPLEKILACARQIAPQVKAYVAAHPATVRPFNPDYLVLCPL